MTDNTHTIDIDAIESRRDDLTREYADIWRSHNDAIGAIPAESSLRDLDDRRDRAARDTAAASEDQRRVADELLEVAESCVEWAGDYLDSGDYSDGLDGLDTDALTRVMDRAILRGDDKRALAAARLLEADGDNGAALSRLAAQNGDVRAALDYLDEYRDPTAVLAALRSATVRMPDDERIRPTLDVARRIEREDADRRAAEERDRLEERQARLDEIDALHVRATNGRLVSDEARTRRKAASRRDPRGRRGRGVVPLLDRG